MGGTRTRCSVCTQLPRCQLVCLVGCIFPRLHPVPYLLDGHQFRCFPATKVVENRCSCSLPSRCIDDGKSVFPLLQVFVQCNALTSSWLFLLLLSDAAEPKRWQLLGYINSIVSYAGRCTDCNVDYRGKKHSEYRPSFSEQAFLITNM